MMKREHSTELELAKTIISTNVGVLYGAFSIIDSSEYFPPLHILNDFLFTGTDACDQDGRMPDWEPFKLALDDYGFLKAWWFESHPDAREDALDSTSWNDWFCAVLEL